ncbi:hypothetical protein GCM10011608_06230 [Micromonospora sonchi]|uniref:Uncharacterized protein n=1 Tax=Micromonospora sonchi TaxID=1763543 RepID=A0A917WS07_9ACTN|nr:hypothetical protein [Micromonospora sonchi]GGM24133.1 hypothetical protein GCM10011608_06230 [Micromonospora sonchi]
MDDAVRIRVAAGADAAALLDWLRVEPELSGCIDRDAAPPTPGSLGTVTDVLVVAVGSGGVATVLASALVSWIRRRAGSAEVRVTLSDGSSIEIRATDVHGLDADGVAALVRQVRVAIAEVPASDG